MRIVSCFICCLLFLMQLTAQDVAGKLKSATDLFEKDSQMRHAIYSLYVIDVKAGKVIFDKNSEIGLAPASCQKLFTSGAAFEILGNGYRYKTEFSYQGKIKNGIVGDITITSSGDPSLGSWRFESTTEDYIINEWIGALRSKKIKSISGFIQTDDSRFSFQSRPGGWIWDDVGNYYGAGAGQLNWRENQFDVTLRSGNEIGSDVEIAKITPGFYRLTCRNEIKAAAKGTGDNAYLYPPMDEMFWSAKGTIPVGERNFVISGAVQNPSEFACRAIKVKLDSAKLIYHIPGIKETSLSIPWRDPDTSQKVLIAEHFSPPLDSLNFWFLRRSINLYGEAFIKTIAFEKTGFGSTEKGVELVQEFWAKQGIDKAAINIIDGSGLSPQNRVTTNSLVKVLQYAKTRPWYNSFYLSLPTYNGMKMKSGSIGGARSFAGYHTSKDGKEYIFAIIVNNYDGSATAMVRKMYQVLDVLK